MKNGSEILRVMDDANLISTKDTRCLEHLLMRIGRNDLYETIQNYHLKRGLGDDSKAKQSWVNELYVAHNTQTTNCNTSP